MAWQCALLTFLQVTFEPGLRSLAFKSFQMLSSQGGWQSLALFAILNDVQPERVRCLCETFGADDQAKGEER